MDPGDLTGGSGTGGSSVKETQNITPPVVRVGLKRELAFALKSHSEVSEFLGRPRLRKPPPSPFAAPELSSSSPSRKKSARKNSTEFLSPDAGIFKTCAIPVSEKVQDRVPVPASQASARPGLSAETPIVVDDVDVARPAMNNAAMGRTLGLIPATSKTEGLVVPGWLEQQVSRITRAGSKYVMEGGEANGFDAPHDATPDIAFSNANRSTRLSSPESVLDSIESTSRDTTRQRTAGKITRKDNGLHKLVFMADVLPEGTMLRYVVSGCPKLVGYAKDSGILCTCCNEVISPSQFEAHAGQAQRRKPYNYIYTSNGVSLHELSVTLSKQRKLLNSENDDLCSICKDAGELVLCDLCPRAFHQACAGLSSVPEGDWHCRYCQAMHQRENYVAYNDNARAAGRVPGVDAIDQILKRCILIVKLPDSRVGGCALCRSKDYVKSGFSQRTVLICDQCEKEYHVGCLNMHGMADLKEKPEGDWFCCSECLSINNALQDVLNRGAQSLPDQVLNFINQQNSKKSTLKDANTAPIDVFCHGPHGFPKPEQTDSRESSTKDANAASSDVLGLGDQNFAKQSLDIFEQDDSKESSTKDANDAVRDVPSHGGQTFPDKVLDVSDRNYSKEISIKHPNADLKWRLFKGRTVSASDKSILSSAVSVLHESFDPIISGKKGADLVTQLVFGRQWGQMDLQGMYCAVLIVDSSVVSVSVLRILGSQAAELPLVATRKDCQGQGYFGALFACVGLLLASLKVKHLVLPATKEAEAMWTTKFGFAKISLDQLYKLARGIKIVDFEGTTLLHRTVSDLLPPAFGSQAR